MPVPAGLGDINCNWQRPHQREEMGAAVPNEQIKQQGRIEFLSTLGLKPDDPHLISARTRLGPQYGITKQEFERANQV